jgi:RNase P/RNase MRP subunit p30
MDLVYGQPLKELLQISSYFKEQLFILVKTEASAKAAKQAGQTPIFLVDTQTDINKIKNKKKAVVGGSVKANEFAVKIKADFLLQPSNEKQFFDLGLAKKLADNNTTVVFMLEEFLGKNTFERHLYWKNYLEVVRYCKKKGTKFFVASGNLDPLNLKHPKIRTNLAIILGLEEIKAKEYLELKDFNK